MTIHKFPENGKFSIAFSYASEQKEIVRPIAEAIVQKLGPKTVFFDEWYEYYINGGKSELKLRDIYKKCILVIVCISKEYDKKTWTGIEHEEIQARRIDDDENSDRILLIRVGEGDVAGFPSSVIESDVRDRSIHDIAKLIIDRLDFINSASEESWSAINLELDWSMANQYDVQNAFANLMSGEAMWRYLPIRGKSESGKSHITKKMYSNVLSSPNFACGRFDFKGTTDINRIMEKFIRYLNVQMPSTDLDLDDQFRDILEELEQNSKVALLIFDNYDSASKKMQEWIEEELLVSIVRNPRLRVVIAGQYLPEKNRQIWEKYASPTIELCYPCSRDWVEFVGQNGSGYTQNDVESLYDILSGNIALLAQIFSKKKKVK